jgi:hypothetical protein
MHPSNQAFGNWCDNEFPELGSRTRSNMMAIAGRFDQHLNAQRLGYSVLAELAAPSVSNDVVERVIAAPIPMKLAEVKALKKSVYKTTSNILEEIESMTTDEIVEQLKESMNSGKVSGGFQGQLNRLTEDQKVEVFGGEEVVDEFKQYELDHSIEDDFDPHACSIGILQSANRLRIWGGNEQIEKSVLHALETSVRMQTYEAQSLLLLGDIIEKHRLKIEAMTQTKLNMNIVH